MSNPNMLNKIFKPKHLLDPLVKRLGSQQAVVEAVIAGLKGIELQGGVNNVMVRVGNVYVHVQVYVENGVAKVNDFWIPR